MSIKRNTLLDSLLLVAYCSLIFWLSAQERLPMPKVFNYEDKLLHFAAYFVMGGLSWRAFRHLKLGYFRLAWASMLFCSVYGLSDEWHQSFVPGRESSHLDWLADSLGAAVAIGAALMLNMRGRHEATENSR